MKNIKRGIVYLLSLMMVFSAFTGIALADPVEDATNARGDVAVVEETAGVIADDVTEEVEGLISSDEAADAEEVVDVDDAEEVVDTDDADGADVAIEIENDEETGVLKETGEAGEDIEAQNAEPVYSALDDGMVSVLADDDVVITIESMDGTSVGLTKSDIEAAESVTDTFTYASKGNNIEVTSTFYSIKSILEAAGYDVSGAHGLKAIAGSDGFVTGYDSETFENAYIYEETPGVYRTAVNGSAGNKWARGVIKLALVPEGEHAWGFKDGACTHKCTICNKDEAAINIEDGKGESTTFHNCEIIQAASETTTKSYGTTEVTATYYSVQDILEKAGYDVSGAHGFKAVASDGFTTGYDLKTLADLYIFDRGLATKADGTAEGNRYEYRTAVDGSAGNKWASDVKTIAIVPEGEHAMFVKNGQCKHYCTICGEDEAAIEIIPSEGDKVTVHDCEIIAAESVDVTMSFASKGSTTEITAKFHSLKSILENAGVDTDKISLIKVNADGFTSKFAVDDLDKVYIYDTGLATKADGTTEGDRYVYRSAMDGSAGNKWAKGVLSVGLEEVDKTELKKATDDASDDAEDTNISEDGSDIESTDVWTDQDAKDALDKAIADAKKVIDNKEADQKDVDDATQKIKDAKDTFDATKQPGKKVSVTGIKLDKTSATATEGDAVQLKSTVSPSNATNKAVTWKSSDTSVATVDANGKVTTKKAGTATITVTTKDGNKTTTCKVTVKAKEEPATKPQNIAVTGIKITPASAELATKKTLQMKVEITPSNATNKAVTWKSSDPSIAKVDANGKVTAIKYGKPVTITATTNDGKKVTTAKIQTRYYDVNDTSKYYFKPVYWAADKGITKGYNDNEYFGPQRNCTRKEMIIFLWRLSGKPSASGSLPFSDTKKMNKNSDGYKAVLWGYKNGIIRGYESGKYKGQFRLNDSVARKDTLIMLYRLAKKPKVSGKIKFPDVVKQNYKPTSDTYKAILWGTQKKITNGYKDGNFKPFDNCLREHIVTFIYRYDKNVK